MAAQNFPAPGSILQVLTDDPQGSRYAAGDLVEVIEPQGDFLRRVEQNGPQTAFEETIAFYMVLGIYTAEKADETGAILVKAADGSQDEIVDRVGTGLALYLTDVREVPAEEVGA